MYKLLPILPCFALLACSTAPSEDLVHAGTQQAQAVDTTVSGFVMPFALSRFYLGSVQRDVVTLGVDQITGTNGGFATFLSTGGSLGVSNANSPVWMMAPYTSNASTHNSVVQAYFFGAGLSPQQVIGVSLTTLIEGHETLGGSSTPTFNGYTSILQRGVESVPVVDSIASAMLRGDGGGGGPLYIAEEHVYWPPFPHSVVDDGHNLQALVNDPARFAAYQARLPTGTSPGSVVIRHSHWTEALSIFACYDVPDGQVMRHFDIMGTELHLPNEVRPLPPADPFP